MVSEEIKKKKKKKTFLIPLFLLLFVCEISIDENTFLINLILIAHCFQRRTDPHVDTFGILVSFLVYRGPLPMIFWHHYSWYINKPIHGILIPYPCYFDTIIHGIVTPYPWYIVPLPMVFWPPIHGILTPYPWYVNPLPMVGWFPYPWYFEPYP